MMMQRISSSMRCLCALLFAATAHAFTGSYLLSRQAAFPVGRTTGRSQAMSPLTTRMLFVEVAKEDEVPEGQRKVIKERGVTLVVAKQEGKMYAFNNKCPHLGLSLKRGEITPANDRHGVCITCPYHKSKFSLTEGGKCKVWSENLLGIKGTEVLGNAISGFVAPMAKSVNPEMKKAAPARVYSVKVEDGNILVDLPPDLTGYATSRVFKDYMSYEEKPEKKK